MKKRHVLLMLAVLAALQAVTPTDIQAAAKTYYFGVDPRAACLRTGQAFQQQKFCLVNQVRW